MKFFFTACVLALQYNAEVACTALTAVQMKSVIRDAVCA